MRSLAIGLSAVALTLSFAACGGDDGKPSTPGTGGTSAGSGGSGGGAGTGGRGGAGGQAGAASTGGSVGAGGAGGSTGSGGTGGQTGTGGAGGAGGGTGGSGPDHGGADGGPHAADSGSPMDGHDAGGDTGPAANKVEFAIAPVGTSMVTGTGMFEVMNGEMMIMVDLKNCPAGRHPVQIHTSPDCSMNGEAAGGHWGRGDNIGDVVCSAAGTGLLHATKMLGYWTIGGPEVSNLLDHALIVHTGNGRIGCGVIK